VCLFTSALLGIVAEPGSAATIYNNLTPNNLMGVASQPSTAGGASNETADDFFVASQTLINSATFVGLIVPPSEGGTDISQVITQFYRVFPFDSNTTRTAQVPTRPNSPADEDFASQDSAANELTFTSSVLADNFTVQNTVQPGGVHTNTHGNGALTGQEVQITVTFATPLDIAAAHYFFVPQVGLTNGGQFYWLSASRPISGPGTTAFPAGVTDLQTWTRDSNLDPDWLRVGADIVGGTTFNQAFSLDGSTVPEPGTTFVCLVGLAFIGGSRGIAAIRKRVRL
jgi:hypothetical protein